MTEVVVFPDASAVVIASVKKALSDRAIAATVGTRIPTPLPLGTFVRIFRTGGLDLTRVIDQAQLTVEVYADDTATAHDVAQLVRGLIHSYSGTVQQGVTIYAVREFSGPQDFPDPLTNSPRYSFTIQVSTRGVAS